MFDNLKKTIMKVLFSPNKYAKKMGVNMGENCSIATRELGTEPYLITLGKYVRVAKGTAFYTHGGLIPLRAYYNDPNLEQMGKISIGDFTSIGAHCLIMPGVKIGKLCIVGGGSVVTKSIPDGCMVAGNPAKFIGYTEDFYKKVKEHDLQCKHMSPSQKKKYLLSLPDDKFIEKKLMVIDSKQK